MKLYKIQNSTVSAIFTHKGKFQFHILLSKISGFKVEKIICALTPQKLWLSKNLLRVFTCVNVLHGVKPKTQIKKFPMLKFMDIKIMDVAKTTTLCNLITEKTQNTTRTK